MFQLVGGCVILLEPPKPSSQLSCYKNATTSQRRQGGCIQKFLTYAGVKQLTGLVRLISSSGTLWLQGKDHSRLEFSKRQKCTEYDSGGKISMPKDQKYHKVL